MEDNHKFVKKTHRQHWNKQLFYDNDELKSGEIFCTYRISGVEHLLQWDDQL